MDLVYPPSQSTFRENCFSRCPHTGAMIAGEGVIDLSALKFKSTVCLSTSSYSDSLPEFLDFILSGRTILAANNKYKLFLASPLRK